ncbi:GTP binding domain-containing protein [Cynara cardunculus var. scolymus]|uniref:GTP binding domain-containing protein n=1 Tax=Cynara cardunculus var. scolymus TaxID=59895 RepID=A0A103XHH9_CYNCS|nr:GTP binding domain-containing protein [Cynara cardunculus var. scolymus]
MSSLDVSSHVSLSRILSLLSPVSKFSPSSSLLFPTRSSNLPLSLSAIYLHNRRRTTTVRSLEGEFVSVEDELPEIEDDVESDFEDVSDEHLDVDELELEAEKAVREYSLSLSKELKIEEEPIDDKGTRGRRKMRERIIPINIPDHLLPKVSIVGRPNVGKSALFNRLVGGNRAIVVDEPGVTRDRLYGRSFWGDHEFMVIDTGGVLTVSKSQTDVMEQQLSVSTTIGMEGIPLASREAAVARMPSMIERQATVAVEESSVIIFVVDGQAGLNAADVEIGDWLRKNYSNKSIILAVNKCESPRKGIMQASEFWSLGFTPLPISAVSGTGTGELLDLVCAGLGKIEESDVQNKEEDYIPSISIVGRPNVGKSSILNALVGEDRTIVSPKFRLIDTAGIRKRAAVASSGSTTEALSVNRAFRAIRRSDVVALVVEALACITEQDYKIAERIEREGKGCLIVVNKWDTIPNKNQQTTLHYEEDVRMKLRILNWAPIVYSTAIAGNSVDRIIVAASAVEKERSRRLSTATLNQVVHEALAFKSPPRTRGGKRGPIRPPTFVFFVNDAKLFPETYRRYMEKQLRSDAGFTGTPIRLLWRSRRKTDKDPGQAPASKPKPNLTHKKLAVAT